MRSCTRKHQSALAMLVLAAVMAVACSVQPGGTARHTVSTASECAATSAPDGQAGLPDPFGKYDPPIEIRFIRDIDDDLQTNIFPKCPGETIDDNRWFQLYREKLGINIKYDWTAKVGDAYTQKLNVILASGDLPDVMGVDPAQLKQLADSDLVADLTQHWDDYASVVTKEYFTTQGPGILGVSTFNGKLLGISASPELFGDGTYIWIRADWLKKLGLDPPQTMDDILAISRAFTDNDPDGNGVHDTLGLAVIKDLYNGCMGLEGFFAGYHAYPYMWIEGQDGKLVYGSTLPEVKTGLQMLAGMYHAGQIDQEFGVKDVGKVAETIAAGRVGMEFGHQWNPMYPLIGNYQNDRNADWTGYSLVSCDEKTVRNPNRFDAVRLWAVRKGYEHPEALIKLINMHLEMCWGETGDFNHYYMPVENGSVGVWKFSPVTPYPPFKNLNSFIAIDEARIAGTLGKLTGEAATIQRNIEAFEGGDLSQWGWMKIYGPDGVLRWGRQYKDNGQYLFESFTGAPTKTMVEKKSTLLMMEKEYFIKIIMGSAGIDEFYKFVSDWNKLGGAEITREVNQWYDAQKAG